LAQSSNIAHNLQISLMQRTVVNNSSGYPIVPGLKILSLVVSFIYS